jgi:hypothetical protein
MKAKVTILADEDIPGEVVSGLRQLGYEVEWIVEGERGLKDPEVWGLAASKGALLLTGDKSYMPQLSRDQILYGPPTIRYSADGILRDELRASELFIHLLDWTLQHCDAREWHFVEFGLLGKHTLRSACWQREKRRRERGI